MSATPTPLRMSVLGGIWRLRALCGERSDLNPSDGARLLATGRSIDAGYDYAGTLQSCSLLSLVLRELPHERGELLRHVIRQCLLVLKPPWALALPYGRSQTYRLLSEDEQQCFLAAGLMAENPTMEVVRWWDELAQAQRASSNNVNLDTGRRAEQLSMAYERQRLDEAGRSDLAPILVAIDDNTLGFDIRSFEADGSHRYIEVKGCSAPPLMFVLSRNEWRAAARIGDKYEVHLWNLSTSNLTSMPFAALAQHIPSDHGDGQWQQVKITLPSK